MPKTDSQIIASEILTDIINQIKESMIGDCSPLTASGLTELAQRLELANDLLGNE